MILTEVIKKDWRVKVLIVLFVLLTVWWRLSQEVVANSDHQIIYQFGSVYFTVAFWGAFCGLASFKNSSKKSLPSKAKLFFSIGLLCQVFGQISYAYYGLHYGVRIPYPSIGDVGYFLSIPAYFFGGVYLAKATNAKIWLQSFENKFEAVMISIVTLAVAYGLFLGGYTFDFTNPLKVFLDFAYPLGQAMYVCIAILVYLAVQGEAKNPMRPVVFLALLGLFVQFLCDYMFVYEASRGTWFSGGMNDYLYLISYFLMSLTILRIR
jgi:hypothetical protein